jgi:hypothetical protein
MSDWARKVAKGVIEILPQDGSMPTLSQANVQAFVETALDRAKADGMREAATIARLHGSKCEGWIIEDDLRSLADKIEKGNA